jgi:hypothetical protein
MSNQITSYFLGVFWTDDLSKAREIAFGTDQVFAIEARPTAEPA